MREEIELLNKLGKIDGITMRKARNNHTVVYWRGKRVATVAASPNGGRRWRANCLAELKRAGVPL